VISRLPADNKTMFTRELLPLLLQVISSWQVVTITIALIFYMYLVTYVASGTRRLRASKSKPRKQPKPAAAAVAAGPQETTAPAGASVNEELGLEEAET
jgi:hypothetical protein